MKSPKRHFTLLALIFLSKCFSKSFFIFVYLFIFNFETFHHLTSSVTPQTDRDLKIHVPESMGACEKQIVIHVIFKSNKLNRHLGHLYHNLNGGTLYTY